MPMFREPTPIDIVYHQLDSALEHASHAWRKLELDGRVPPLESWPPSTDDTVPQSAEYHLASMLFYVKQSFDLLSGEVEKIDKS